MLPNEVKPYSESYQYLWKHRKNYQEFRFNIMNMLVPDEKTIITTITLEQFDFACHKIAIKVKQHPKTISTIHGIPRGGLIPAVRLSHLLQLPLTDTIDKETLLIDDISDEGKTLQPYINKVGIIATLVYHPQSSIIPDIWVYEKGKNWIVFPWEQP